MIYQPVGIRSIAIAFPSIIRTNDYYRENHPDLIAGAERKSLSKLFSTTDSSTKNEFDLEMLPYMSDPFRGTVERRVFADQETSLSISCKAAKDALDAAKLSCQDIDLMLVATIFPEQIVPGNAAFVAEQLGFRGAAWNLDSACSSAVVVLQTATALVRAGEYKNILAVICTNYSKYSDENDTLSFLSGDGAGAFVVSSLEANQGVLGTKILNTSCTCGTFYNELTTDSQGQPRMFIRAGKGVARAFSDTSKSFVSECCFGALEAAGVSLDDIDLFAFNTPTAWYSSACARVLGIDHQRTIDLHQRYANIGPVLALANLYHGAELGRIGKNDLVLCYAIGSVSNAGASVMRWGDVAIGPSPANPVSVKLHNNQI